METNFHNHLNCQKIEYNYTLINHNTNFPRSSLTMAICTLAESSKTTYTLVAKLKSFRRRSKTTYTFLAKSKTTYTLAARSKQN